MRTQMCIVLLAALLQACGRSPDTNLVPVEIKPYYNEYIALNLNVKAPVGDIMFADDMRKTSLGECSFTSGANYWGIKININRWKDFSQSEKRTLIYHELTHCLFMSPIHSTDPDSYMNAKETGLNPDKEELLNEVQIYTKSLN